MMFYNDMHRTKHMYIYLLNKMSCEDSLGPTLGIWYRCLSLRTNLLYFLLSIIFEYKSVVILSNGMHTTKQMYDYLNKKEVWWSLSRTNIRYFTTWYSCPASRINFLFALLSTILEYSCIWYCLKVCIQLNIFTIT